MSLHSSPLREHGKVDDMWLFLAFVAVPLIEIALFIQVGGAIGLFPTLGVVILTAVAGTILVRSQGAAALQRLQKSFQGLEDPTTPLADGAMILFAGALLLTPGFFTDAVGFLLLVPQSRAVIRRYIATRIQVHAAHTAQHPQSRAEPDIIDVEYEDVTPKEPSGWTKS